MFHRNMIWALALLAALAMVAAAADINGQWKSEMAGPDGQTRVTDYVFKVDGEKLTGTVASRMGESQITDGKVSGDDVSFSVVRNFGGNEVKVLYKGKVAGDEIKFTIEFGGADRTFEVTAKRVK